MMVVFSICYCYIDKKLHVAGISKIEIERTAKFVKINVYTAKPGLISSLF